MIKANELRIGSIVWESNSFTPGPEDFEEIIVVSINDIDKVIRDDHGNGYSYDALYGIPLTPEWLERCGFKNKPPRSLCYNNGRISVCNHNEDGTYWFSHDGNQSMVLYVHQLQNLYFALTGVELTIKQ